MFVRIDRTDAVLLGTYLLIAGLGTWTRALLLNDGAVLMTAGWLGNAWDIYFSQIPGRAVSVLISFGPAWILQSTLGLSPDTYIVAAHVLYFAAPICLWLVLRFIEPLPIFSHLYLAAVLVLVYFPTELIPGIGLWTIWAAWTSDFKRSTRHVATATVLASLVIAFTHPSVALLSLCYASTGLLLRACGRPIPQRPLLAAAVLGLLVLFSSALISISFPTTNSTIAAALAINRYDYVNPVWMLATLGRFPLLAVLWLLLLAPGAADANLRWQLSPIAIYSIGFIGLCLAASSTVMLTWIYARHMAIYVFALALALGLSNFAVIWLRAARLPLMLYSGTLAIAALSFNYDISLYSRFVDRHLQHGVIDVAELPASWPSSASTKGGIVTYLKWAAMPNYVRDVVIPEYDWYRLTLAFYSFFRSDGQSVLYHSLDRRTDWIPYECTGVDRVKPMSAADHMLTNFLKDYYCIR